MNDVRGFAKCALGFIISLLIIAGAIFGFDIDVKVNDTHESQMVVTEAPSNDTTTPTVTTAVEDEAEDVDQAEETVDVSTEKTEETKGEKENA